MINRQGRTIARRVQSANKYDLFALLNIPPWYADALCAQTSPEAFFPEKGGSTREAKKICARCPVRQQCLEYAVTNKERWGIWGAHSERERRGMAAS